MSKLNETPSGERLHISIFGRRNAGKSSVINALTGQNIAIVSDVAGTTTDPVAKAIEILPIGPVILTDTAGIDDAGALGELRVEKSMRVLEKTDLVILVIESGKTPGHWEDELVQRVNERKIPIIAAANKIDLNPNTEEIEKWVEKYNIPFVKVSAYNKSNIDKLKELMIASAPKEFREPSIIGDLLSPGDLVVLVTPIDSAAPKGRLILPQVMTLRDILDHDAFAIVAKENELKSALGRLTQKPQMVITDSQVFHQVAADTPDDVLLTGFSILMARYKGDLDKYVYGARALRTLKPGNRVMISEGCTHHRQSDDIGTVKIPRLLNKSVGGELEFGFSSGVEFPEDINTYDLIIHCGACTLNRREVLYRQSEAEKAGVPMTNYGITLAYLNGILDRALMPFPQAIDIWNNGREL